MKTLIQLLIFFITFLIALLICELFIRASRLETVSPTDFYDDIGRGRRRNLEYLYFNEGFGIGKFNEHRFIGKSVPMVKAENTVRIALMGDSFVESFQVFERHYFGEIAETQLNSMFESKKFEFLNFGRSGFDIADIYAYQKNLTESFNTDYIFYILSGNDLEPHYSDFLWPRTVLKNDSLIIKYDYLSSDIQLFEGTKFLTQNSVFLNMLNNCRKKTRLVPISSVIFDKLYYWMKEPNKEDTINITSVFSIHPVTEKIVKSLDCNKVIIVNRNLTNLPAEFEQLCKSNGLKYIDLSPALQKMKRDGIDPGYWKVTKKYGHWNHEAHKVIGEELASHLSEIVRNNQEH